MLANVRPSLIITTENFQKPTRILSFRYKFKRHWLEVQSFNSTFVRISNVTYEMAN